MAKTKKTKSAYADAWRRLKKNKVAMVSLVVIVLLIAMALYSCAGRQS